MTSENHNNIEVKVLDSSKAEEIKSALNNAKADDEGNKFVYLNLESTSGDVSASINLISSINSMDAEIIANCNGEIDLAGVLLAAGSKFGKRKATSLTMFRLFEDDKSIGKKRTSLSANEKNALEMLDAFSGGKKSRIKAILLKGLKVTASEAKSLGLIDEVEGFTDRYAAERAAAKKKSVDESEKEVR